MSESRRTIRCFLLATTVLTVVPWSANAADPWIKHENVKIETPDGVSLGTDIFLPEEGTAFPAIMVRTPYDKRGKQWLARALVPKGYAVVLQDVRGMNASTGAFEPFLHEKADGLTTLDWIAAQPWSNGSVGAWGTSYVAYCALILAPTKHPALKTVINMSGWGDGAHLAYPGGAMHLMLMAPWMLSNQIHGKGSFHDYDWSKAFHHVPVSEIPTSLGVRSVQWEAAMKASLTDPEMKATLITENYEDIRIPILHVTGWNDFVARGSLDVYEAVDRTSNSPFQKLIVGPWRHDQIWLETTKVGDEDYGREARMGFEKIGELCARWYDRWLKGEKNGVTTEKPVRLFVMGANTWREFDQWPPASATFERWYLDSDGHANGADGDGRLGPGMPMKDLADRFVFDPMNPVPTVGGVNFHFFLDNLGPKDQRPVEAREDVLVYTSLPASADMEVIGPVQAIVYAASAGKQTDFTAKLVVVRDDGYARIVEDGIRRGPDPVDGVPVETMEPGRVYKFTIDLGATALRVERGYRLRLEVSSSNFPKYTRNPNTGENPERATDFLPVNQQVFHTKQYPSSVVLPVVR